MDEALLNVNKVIFTNSLQKSQEAYTEWSKSYDKDIDALFCATSIETAEMFEKHAMNSETLLDVGSGKKSCLINWGY